MISNESIYAYSLEKLRSILGEIRKSVIGKDDVIAKVLMAMIAQGHVLIEDIPGVGKTTMAVSFSKALALKYNRVQFTPDVLPTDILGFSVYSQKEDTFRLKKGAAVCNLFLADEINRTSSKTQSALLEVMEEKRISVEGKSYDLPKPYIVIATQNPVGSVGTHTLPESQLDRFMIRISMGYPSVQAEINILKNKGAESTAGVMQVSTAEEILTLQKTVESIYVDDRVYDYMVRLSCATRVNPMIKLGLSPRGTLSLCAMSKAMALFHGRGYVIPDDVSAVFCDVAGHRLLLQSKASLSGITVEQICADIIKTVPLPNVKG